MAKKDADLVAGAIIGYFCPLAIPLLLIFGCGSRKKRNHWLEHCNRTFKAKSDPLTIQAVNWWTARVRRQAEVEGHALDPLTQAQYAQQLKVRFGEMCGTSGRYLPLVLKPKRWWQIWRQPLLWAASRLSISERTVLACAPAGTCTYVHWQPANGRHALFVAVPGQVPQKLGEAAQPCDSEVPIWARD